MRSGHVRERAADVIDALVLDAIGVGRPIPHAGVLLLDGDDPLRQPAPGYTVALRLVDQAIRFNEHSAGERQRPVARDEPLEGVLGTLTGFPRERQRGVRRAEAVAGVVVGATHLVPRRRLPADADLLVRLLLLVPDAAALVGLVGPRVRVVGVLVPVESRDVVGVHVVARRAEEPDLVAQDRAAERRVDVPVRLDLVRLARGRGESGRRSGCRSAACPAHRRRRRRHGTCCRLRAGCNWSGRRPRAARRRSNPYRWSFPESPSGS